jgi:hypothetical protein
MIIRIGIALLVLATLGCGAGGVGAADGLKGRSVLTDDTGRGDVSDSGGWMLVMPAERISDLRAAVGEPEDLGRASFTIDRDAAEGAGGALVEVDGDGDYALEASGPTLLCRLPAEGSARGCAEIDLPAAGTVVTAFGEGGFAAWMED